MALDRTVFNAWVDDDGTNTTGTLINKAAIDTGILDPIDAALAALGGGTPGGSNTQVQFNDSSAFGGDAGLTYNKTTDALTVAGPLFVGDTTNVNMTLGLTLNQGAADNEILALKSSDIAHGMTDVAETDTYGTFSKWEVTEGGLQIAGYAEGASGAFTFLARGTTDDTSKATSSLAYLNVLAQKKSAATVGAIGANANIIRFANSGTTRFILDGDGDSHQDVGTAWTTFDTEDDVAVLNLLTAYVTRPDDPLRATFAHWLVQSRTTLERLRLVTFNDDGHHFVNMSRLTMLLVGAVRQLGNRMDRLEQRLMALEA